MACNGCGTSTGLTKEQVENLINKLIDEGKLQGGLTDCDDRRLWRDARIVTCDKDKYLEEVSYNQQTKIATFKMSDKSEFTLNLSDFIGRGDLGRGLVIKGSNVEVSTDGTKITFNQHGELTANTTPYVDVFGDPYINAF